MSEHVVDVTPAGPPWGDAALGRIAVLAERLGTRHATVEEADAAFALLAAAKGRHSVIGRVRRHVCLHDSGVGYCGGSTVEV